MKLSLKRHWPLFVLAAAVFALFWPALVQPSAVLYPTFSPFSDVMVIHWPKAHLMAQSWQAGRGLPHWTPLILSGMPLAANQLAMLSYPPAWLFLIFPIEPVFNLLFIFHLLLGGFGLYILLYRVHGLRRSAAMLGSLAFLLNGKWLAHVAGGHVSMVGAIGWMPWALVGLHLLLQECEKAGEQRSFSSFIQAGWGWLLLTALALAMQIVTHTLLFIYTVYLLGAVLVWRLAGWLKNQPAEHAKNSRQSLTWAFVGLTAVFVVAGLLGAAQLLPLLELAQYSNRALSPAEAAAFSVSPAQLLVGLFLPSAQGGHEFIIYLGLVPLLLAPLGLTRQNRWSWFYGLLFVFAVLFALGQYTPVHPLFYYAAPGFRWVRTPARIFFVGGLAIAALAGFGADRLAKAGWSPTARRRLARAAIILASLALLTGLGLAFGFGHFNRAALALAIFAPITLIMIVLRIHRLVSSTLTLFLLGVALFLDLASFDLSMMQFVSREQALAPGRTTAAYLAEKIKPGGTLFTAETGSSSNPAPFRVYSPSYSLPMQTAAAAGISLADGVEPVHLALYDQYMAWAGGYNQDRFSVTIPDFGNEPVETALRDVKPALKLLGLLNVEYLASAFPMPWPGLILEKEIDDTFIYRNEHSLPRAWVAYRTVPVRRDWLAQLQMLPAPADVVLVESRSRLEEEVNRPASPAKVTDYSADFIGIEAELEAPGWLVLSEIWYPGWQVTINGSPGELERVNGLLRGLYLDGPGRYRVTLEYLPLTIIWGNRITGLTAVLLVVVTLGWAAVRQRKKSTGLN